MTKSDVFKQTLFSRLLLTGSAGKRIAYAAVTTALCVVANMYLEFRFLDIQFSLTIAVSALAGVILGPVFGFAACFIGDFSGYMLNSWGQLYMPWVGLSTGMIAVLSGLIVSGIRWKFRGALYVKLTLVCVLSFLLCTVAINTTGFYFYLTKVGFSEKLTSYVFEKFGTGVSYLGYLFYRLFVGGQIWNCLANYALLFALTASIAKIRPLKEYIDFK